MARNDYGAISVISDDEKAALGIGGSKKPEDEGLFETVGKAADKIGETPIGQKIGAVLTIIMLALISGGANLTILDDYFNGDDGPTRWLFTRRRHQL